MYTTCLDLIDNLNKSVDRANYNLINNMTQYDVGFDLVCIKPNITYEYFYQNLKQYWQENINHFINQTDKCGPHITDLIGLGRYLTPEKLKQYQSALEAMESSDFLERIDVENIVLDTIAYDIMGQDSDLKFEVDRNVVTTINNLSSILLENCKCQMSNIFKTFVKKYRKKYYLKFAGKTREDIIEQLRDDYKYFKELLEKANSKGINRAIIPQGEKSVIDGMSNNLAQIYGFSIRDELNGLIPSQFGSLKDFFVEIISKYYENLHPIIWAQIFKNSTEKIFVELPITKNEMFGFISQNTLLNSGPFILKILQLIRPVLSPELAEKYHLTKLTYPLMTPEQVDLILERAVNQWNMYQILDNYSASVGHVCKVSRVDQPEKIFMIKIIKPLAIAQSCWEYKTLYDVFPRNTCERNFVRNMLESNGTEMNVFNEIRNIESGHKYYNATYQEIFGKNIDARLTAVNNVPGIIVPNCWFALAMTLAPGVPLSKLVEDDSLEKDTKYRAKLHRCLDLLVYRFFFNLIENGFYHGDLHAGNIFFSYQNNQITLIDFGAVGNINLFENDSSTKKLIEIIIMSSFYNYDEMLDEMTDLVNSRCSDVQIDKTSIGYKNLRTALCQYKINNAKNYDEEKKMTEDYKEYIFGEQRINSETSSEYTEVQNQPEPWRYTGSIYSYLEFEPRNNENIMENRDDLSVSWEKIGNGENITFSGVLEKIIQYYAASGVNIPVRFNEFYELQKAYALLMGVLSKVNYSSYRTRIIIDKGILTPKHIPNAITHLSTTFSSTKIYNYQKDKFDKLMEELKNGKISDNHCNLEEKEIDQENKKKIKGGFDNYYYKYLKYKSRFNSENHKRYN